MPLTNSSIASIPPLGKPKKYFDAGGLYLFVASNYAGDPRKGGMLWRMNYRFAGKSYTLSFGGYPLITIKEARLRRDDAKRLLSRGINPGAAAKSAKAEAEAERRVEENTFDKVAGDWYQIKKESYRESHQRKITWVISLLSREIGKKPISKIDPNDILSVIRPIQDVGHRATAHKMAQVAGQICRYARRCGYTKYNPADGLTEALKPVKSKHYATIINPDGIGDLLRTIDSYPGFVSIRYALKILPYVFLRGSELRGAYWTEIDFEKALWIVPAERQDKNKTGMKMRRPHIVPLANQVVSMFNELNLITGTGKLCFPSPYSNGQCISDVGLINALRRMGYARGEMTIHGFRAMFSTVANEKGINSDYIEAQLAHIEPNKVKAAYNHAQYLDQRRRMMQEWADHLDSLRSA
jgi:integrase